MGVKVTVELSEELAHRARAVADQTHRSFEEVLVALIDRAAAEPAVELLPDDQVLALCNSEMAVDQQVELSELLEQNREGLLEQSGQNRLEELLRVYRRGLVCKAQALRIAGARGLKPPLQ